MIYIGVRVEINSKNIKKDFKEIYNKNGRAKIFDLCENGRITINKNKEMLLVCGKKDDKHISNLTNFSLMVGLEKSKSDIERIVKIINVLGNDRLIKEKVKTFVLEQSILNKIGELSQLKQAFVEINGIIPNFIELAWYYAPEAKIE